MIQIVEVTTTCPTESEAKLIGSKAVESGLAAGASFWDTSAIYRWADEICFSEEWITSIRTVERNIPELEALVERLHSYVIPRFTVTKLEASQHYGTWVERMGY